MTAISSGRHFFCVCGGSKEKEKEKKQKLQAILLLLPLFLFFIYLFIFFFFWLMDIIVEDLLKIVPPKNYLRVIRKIAMILIGTSEAVK